MDSTRGSDDLDSIGDLGEHGGTTRLDLVHLPECVPLSTSGWLASLDLAVGNTLLLCLHLDVCVPSCQFDQQQRKRTYLDILVISSVLSGVNFFGSSASRKAFMSFSYANSTKTDPCASQQRPCRDLTVTHLEFTLALALESLALNIFTPLPDSVDGTKLGEPFF